MNRKGRLLIAALLTGFLTATNIWLLYLAVVVSAVLFVIKRVFGKEEANFLMLIFLIALTARLAVISLLQFYVIKYGNGVDLFGDGMSYSMNAFFIAESLKHDLTKDIFQQQANDFICNALPLKNVFNWNWALPDEWMGRLPGLYHYQVTGYGYFLSFLYYLFGYKPVVGIVFNALLGSLLCLFVYTVTKRLTGDVTSAKISAILAALYPTLLLWSTTNLKDIAVTFFNFMIVLFIVLAFQKRSRLMFSAVIFLLFLQWTIRDKFIFGYLIYCGFFFIWLNFSSMRRTNLLLNLYLAASFILLLLVLRPEIIALLLRGVYGTIAAMFDNQRYQVFEKGTSYKILSEIFYSSGPGSLLPPISFSDFLKGVSLGYLHAVFEPLPFRITLKNAFFILPYILFNYILVIFSVYGFSKSLKESKTVFWIILLNLLIFGFSIAVSEGNIGGLLRHRDITAPIFLIFAAVGIRNIGVLLVKKR